MAFSPDLCMAVIYTRGGGRAMLVWPRPLFKISLTIGVFSMVRTVKAREDKMVMRRQLAEEDA